MRQYIIGVDVGGTTVKIGKFNLGGNLLEKWNINTDKSNNGENILKDIYDSIKSVIPLQEIKGIGLGVPGPVINNVVMYCVNLGWGRLNLEEELRNIFEDEEIIIKVANDASIATAGEMFRGIAKGYNNIVMFTLGTGVGGGIIVNKKLIEGKNGGGGELGHLKVDNINKFQCNCGKKGCLDTVSSATGIVHLAYKHLNISTRYTPLRKYKHFSAKKVIDLAKQGDYIASKIVDEAMYYLAVACANVTFTLDPEIIVIGGGVSNAGEFLIKKIEKYYYEMVEPFITKMNFAIATLGNDAGIYGCYSLLK